MVSPPQAQAMAVPACPRCGGPGVFHAQANRWGCDRCQGYLDQMGPSLGAPPAISAGAAQDAERAARRAQAGKNMVVGIVLLVVGIGITAATHDAAESNGGGTYVIAYGPMIVGGIRFFQGLFGMMA
jgi:ribosomal protein L37AE/L43A